MPFDEQYPDNIYKFFFDNSIDLLCVATAEGNFVKLNAEWEKTLGYSSDNLEKKQYLEFVHPDDLQETTLVTQGLSENKQVHNFRNRYKHINGTYLWLEWSLYLIDNLILASARDITCNKETKEALRRKEEQNSLEDLDKINVAIQSTNDLNDMMKNAVEATRTIFKCDRAFLIYPNDPGPTTWEISSESSDPEYPCTPKVGGPVPMSPIMKELFTQLNSMHEGPLELYPDKKNSPEEDPCVQFQAKSALITTLHPKLGKPWQLVIQQCSGCREWTLHEKRLFQEISRRLTDGLSTHLIYKEQQDKEVFLDKIFENIPNMLIVKDAETLNFIRINKAGEELLGYSQSELYGKNDYDIFPQKDADNFTSSDQHALQTKKMVNIPEEKIKNKHNQILYVHTRKLAILDEAGKPKYVLGISEDITEQKQTEMALKQNRMLTDALLESVPGLVYIYNEDNLLELWNKRFETETGYSGEELFLKPLMDWFRGSEKDIDAIQAGLARIYNGKFGQAEAYLQKKNGEKAPYYFTAVPTEINGKKYIIGIGIDIATQIKAESALRETKERLEAFLNSATDSISIYDSKMRLAEINRISFRYLATNVKKENIIGTNITDFLSRFKVNSVLHNYKKVLATGTPYYSEDKIILEGNTKIWFNTKIFKVGDGIGIISSDISALKEAEEKVRSLNAELEHRVAERTAQLEQANRDLESFAYSVSHDLRAPIRHIDGFVRLIQSNIARPEDKIAQYFDRIFSASKRMSEMIDELLNFSRLGRKPLNFAPVKLHELVLEILDHLKPDFANRKITWRINDMPIVGCDKNLMRIAFENIISNAIKYTSKEPEAYIEIGTKSVTKDMAVIYFKDNGAGFDMIFADKLFGVFQRLHSSDDFEGVGIGLANVKQIILKHNGQITVDSKINKGTTFYLYLPKNLENG